MARDFLAEFQAADAAIAESVWVGDAARKAAEAARTHRAYQCAMTALHAAQDAHTAAWQQRHAVCAAWDEHFRFTYGKPATQDEGAV